MKKDHIGKEVEVAITEVQWGKSNAITRHLKRNGNNGMV
jgi:hypothetical protein